MARLTRLLQEAVGENSTPAESGRDELQDLKDLQDATAEQLFSENLLSQRLLKVRKQAAAICAAKPIRMSALLEDNTSVRGAGGVSSAVARVEPPADVEAVGDCTASSVHTGVPLSDAIYAPLQRISLTQCRDVFQVLCELDEMQQQTWKEQSNDGYRLLVLAPLCELLGPFTTPSGLNPTGEGMRRMLQLALKRAHASAPVQIRVIQPSEPCLCRPLQGTIEDGHFRPE